MRLLLTRAAEEAVRTRGKLEALGHKAILTPVFEIVGTGALWPAGVVDAMLATSGQAFTIDFSGPLLETRRVLPLYVVGARTAELAHSQGYLGETFVGKNAAALAVTLRDRPGRPMRIVYLAGRDRKSDLETSLTSTNHVLDVVETYEARALGAPSDLALKAVRQNAVDGAMHFSRRSAMLFLAHFSGMDVRRLAHFCLSEDVAAPLRQAGCAAIYVAEEPNEASLLGILGRPESGGKA